MFTKKGVYYYYFFFCNLARKCFVSVTFFFLYQQFFFYIFFNMSCWFLLVTFLCVIKGRYLNNIIACFNYFFFFICKFYISAVEYIYCVWCFYVHTLISENLMCSISIRRNVIFIFYDIEEVCFFFFIINLNNCFSLLLRYIDI